MRRTGWLLLRAARESYLRQAVSAPSRVGGSLVRAAGAACSPQYRCVLRRRGASIAALIFMEVLTTESSARPTAPSGSGPTKSCPRGSSVGSARHRAPEMRASDVWSPDYEVSGGGLRVA